MKLGPEAKPPEDGMVDCGQMVTWLCTETAHTEDRKPTGGQRCPERPSGAFTMKEPKNGWFLVGSPVRP